MRERLPNDQFLLYAFDAPAADVAALLRRAAAIPDLRLRIRDVPWHLDYPVWVERDVTAADVVTHGATTWDECRDAVASLLGTVLDPRDSPWRLHVFTGVRGVPHCGELALVAVLQLSHALADGRAAAGIARALFAAAPVVDVRPPAASPSAAALLAGAVARTPVLVARMINRSVGAARAYRTETELVRNGTIPPKSAGYELTSFNIADDSHSIRMVATTVEALHSAGSTVSVGALTAISEAMRRYLARERLGAEVTVARPVIAGHRNNFHNVGVDLHVEEPDLVRRAAMIGASLAERRTRSDHPAVVAQGLATRVTPAPLIRYGVRIADLTGVPNRVAGNTVVTSVNRGPDDLVLGGGPVRFTAGFPALSPVMGVTHGVYAIGDTLTICVHSSRAALPDPDRYAEILEAAVAEVGRRA